MTSNLYLLSPDLAKSIDDHTATIEMILSDPSIFGLFRMNYKPLTDFLCLNAKQLLLHAFSKSRTPLSDSAFNIITAGHIVLLQEMASNDLINEAIIEVLSENSSEGPSDFQLSRISDVISTVFSVDLSNFQVYFPSKEIEIKKIHSKIKDTKRRSQFFAKFRTKKSAKKRFDKLHNQKYFSFEFLYILLKYVDNINITFLFRMLFGRNDRLIPIQNIISSMKFTQNISSALFHMDYMPCPFDEWENCSDSEANPRILGSKGFSSSRIISGINESNQQKDGDNIFPMQNSNKNENTIDSNGHQNENIQNISINNKSDDENNISIKKSDMDADIIKNGKNRNKDNCNIIKNDTNDKISKSSENEIINNNTIFISHSQIESSIINDNETFNNENDSDRFQANPASDEQNFNNLSNNNTNHQNYRNINENKVAGNNSNRISSLPKHNVTFSNSDSKLPNFNLRFINSAESPSSNVHLYLDSNSSSTFSVRSDHEEDLHNPIYIKMESLYKILNTAALNPIFQPEFVDLDVYSCLLQRLHVPYFVLDAQWQTIYNIVPTLPFAISKYFIEPASSMFHSTPTHIHMYHCYSLKMLSFLVKERSKFVNQIFLNTILAMFIKFDTCTMFHESVRHFVFASMMIPKVNIEVAITFIPILIVECELRQYGIVASSAFPILNAVYNTSLKNKELAMALTDIDGFDIFIRKFLKRYQLLISNDYGGPKAQQSYFVLNPKSMCV